MITKQVTGERLVVGQSFRRPSSFDPVLWTTNAVAFYGFFTVVAGSGKWYLMPFFQLKDLQGYTYFIGPFDTEDDVTAYLSVISVFVNYLGLVGGIGEWWNFVSRRQVVGKSLGVDYPAWLAAH